MNCRSIKLGCIQWQQQGKTKKQSGQEKKTHELCSNICGLQYSVEGERGKCKLRDEA